MNVDEGQLEEIVTRLRDERGVEIHKTLARYAAHGIAVPLFDVPERVRKMQPAVPWAMAEDALAEASVPPGALIEFLGLTDERTLADPRDTINRRFVTVPGFLLSPEVIARLETAARFRLLQRRDFPGRVPLSVALLPRDDYDRPDAYEPRGPRTPPGTINRPDEQLPDAVDCLLRAVNNTFGFNGVTFWICLDDTCTRSLEAVLAGGGPSAASFVITVARFAGASVTSALGVTSAFLEFLFGSASPWGIVAIFAEIIGRSISAAMLRDNNRGQGVCIRVICGVLIPYVTPAGSSA
jgi:hypothetical protein